MTINSRRLAPGQGLKTLASDGFHGVKPNRWRRQMGVSRGKASTGTFAISARSTAGHPTSHWRDIAAEQIIGQSRGPARAMKIAGIVCFARHSGGSWYWRRPVRTWPRSCAGARRGAGIDRRRLGYVVSLFKASGLPDDVARPAPRLVYWAFLGFALVGQTIAAGPAGRGAG